MSYKVNIQSLVPSLPFVGITGQVEDYTPVRLNPVDNIWTVTPQPANEGVMFKIGKYTDTGVNDMTEVVASNMSFWSERWYTPSHPRCNGGHTIEILDSNPAVGWTVSGTSDTAPIAVRPIDISKCDPSQLFNLVPVAGN